MAPVIAERGFEPVAPVVAERRFEPAAPSVSVERGLDPAAPAGLERGFDPESPLKRPPAVLVKLVIGAVALCAALAAVLIAEGAVFTASAGGAPMTGIEPVADVAVGTTPLTRPVAVPIGLLARPETAAAGFETMTLPAALATGAITSEFEELGVSLALGPAFETAG
jgi:hypothetical protein